MPGVTPFLWYDGAAEEAARFYVSLLPDSRIDSVARPPADPASDVEPAAFLVEFTLAGRPFIALNGGPQFRFTEAVSFQISTADQAETDRLWEALIAEGGQESMCGWLKDRWGLSWQVVPSRLPALLGDPDPGRAGRARDAMLKMRKIDIAALERAADGA